MYIERANPDEIPPDAIRMTRDEVHEYIVDRIHKWPNTLELSVVLFKLIVLLYTMQLNVLCVMHTILF